MSESIDSSVMECPLKKSEKKVLSKNLVIKCKHGRQIPAGKEIRTFHLVPDANATGISEEINIVWTGNDPPPKPEITMSGLKGDGDIKKISGSPYKIPLDINILNDRGIFPQLYKDISSGSSTSKDIHEISADLLQTIFTYNYERHITISDLPFGSLDVLIHNPDQWELEINLPFAKTKSKETGVKFEKEWGGQTITTTTNELKTKNESFESKSVVTDLKRGDGITKTESESKHIKGTKQTSNEGTVYKSPQVTKKTGGGDTKEEEVVNPNNILKISHNNKPLNINGLRVIGMIAQVVKMFENIKTIIDDIPKAGVYITYGYTLMDGSIKLNLGWKEDDKDVVFSAYYLITGSVNITIAEVSLELGVGVSGLGFKAQAYVSIEGALSFEGDINKKIYPEGDKEEIKADTSDTASTKANKFMNNHGVGVHAELIGEITGTIGARFEAWGFLKIEANVHSGLEMKGAIDVFKDKDKLFEAEISLEFTGIVGTYTYSVGGQGMNGEARSVPEKAINGTLKAANINAGVSMDSSSSYDAAGDGNDHVFMPPKQLFVMKFPDDLIEYKDPKTKLSDLEIKALITRMIEGHYKGSGFFFPKTLDVRQYKTQEEYDKEHAGFFKGIMASIDYSDTKKVSADSLADTMSEVILGYQMLERSASSIELLLSVVRKDIELMIASASSGFITLDDYNNYVNTNMPTILIKYADSTNEYLTKYGQKAV